MKVALEGLSPGQVAWSRLILGALTLGLFVALRREPLPRSIKVWAHMTVLAISFCVVPFLLFSWAQQHVTSGLASIYNATTPIMTAVMAGLLFRVEKLKAVQIAGILVGILGVMVIIAPWQGLDSQPEPRRPVRDPRRDRLLRLQPRLHAPLRLQLRHERAGVLVPEHRDRRGHHAPADAGRRPLPGAARSVDRRQRHPARLPGHRRGVHLEPEHAARVGSDPGIDGDLHHARGRRGAGHRDPRRGAVVERARRGARRLPRHPARAGPVPAPRRRRV